MGPYYTDLATGRRFLRSATLSSGEVLFLGDAVGVSAVGDDEDEASLNFGEILHIFAEQDGSLNAEVRWLYTRDQVRSLAPRGCPPPLTLRGLASGQGGAARRRLNLGDAAAVAEARELFL